MCVCVSAMRIIFHVLRHKNIAYDLHFRLQSYLKYMTNNIYYFSTTTLSFSSYLQKRLGTSTWAIFIYNIMNCTAWHMIHARTLSHMPTSESNSQHACKQTSSCVYPIRFYAQQQQRQREHQQKKSKYEKFVGFFFSFRLVVLGLKLKCHLWKPLRANHTQTVSFYI